MCLLKVVAGSVLGISSERIPETRAKKGHLGELLPITVNAKLDKAII